jgi:hypothetical protein
MTKPLSPVAQAVLDAFNREARPEPHHQQEAIAAALRAAADQVVPEDGDPIYGLTPTKADRQIVRRKFLDIAAELKAS